MTTRCGAFRLASVALSVAILSTGALAGMRGDPEAVTAAKRLLEQAGGATVWRSPYFEVTERIFLASSGEIAQIHVVRDLERYVRLSVSERPGRRIVEWIGAEGGWTSRNGVVTQMDAAGFAADRQGLRQEPYAIYHRIATEDATLHAELRDDGRLMFLDADERVLCWFRLAPNGTLLSWGNFYDGSINEGYYGPIGDFGSVRLPRYGISTTGAFRFEYLTARFVGSPPEEPESPPAN